MKSRPQIAPHDHNTPVIEKLVSEVSSLSALVRRLVKRPASTPTELPPPRIKFIEGKHSVILDGNAIVLTEEQHALVKLLHDAYPDWVGQRDREERKFHGDPFRIIAKLPPDLATLIKRKPGAGCRLKTK